MKNTRKSKYRRAVGMKSERKGVGEQWRSFGEQHEQNAVKKLKTWKGERKDVEM